MSDAWTLLQSRRRSSGGAPVVTFVDDARAVRTELSAVTLENAAAKIANALREEFELDSGAVIGLHLPPHWQRSAWCAGAWTAGCVVAPGATDVDLVVTSADLAPDLVGGTADVAVVSLHPFGLPLTSTLPAGAVDVTVAVRQQPDAYLHEPPAATLSALRLEGVTLTQGEAFARAQQRAIDWGLSAGGRLLVTDGIGAVDAWLAALAVPLAADASVLLWTGGVPSVVERERERVSATAGS